MINDPNKGTHLSIELVPGSVAPRYPQGSVELECTKVIITEQGMQSGLPIVDFQMKGDDGKFYFFMVSGRLMNAVSAAIKGINTRIHGTPEP